MIRLLLLILLLIPARLLAQDAPAPIIETTLDQTEAIPGQSVTLRLTVLVPSWMPTPPDLPTFEAPNLRVRLPARATTPISRQVDGENWSGISRRYLLTPMLPGQINLPPQEIRVTFAGPDGTTPVTATAQTPALTLTGKIPAGAEGLDPFIAANSLVLTQDLSGPTTGLPPGASVTRSVTAEIKGSSPITLPQLLQPIDLPAIRVYPASPQVNESPVGDDTQSGSRTESETLMAVGGGSGHVPPIRLDWFNLGTGKVETAQTDGFDISVTGPPAKAPGPAQPRDWRRLDIILAAIAALSGAGYWLGPRILARIGSYRAHKLASKAHARRSLLAAITARDYALTSHWLAEWQERAPATPPAQMRPVSDALAGIGATRYRLPQPAKTDAAWRELAQALRDIPDVPNHQSTPLPALNPGHG